MSTTKQPPVGSRPIPPERLEKVRDEYLRGALVLSRQTELAREWGITTRQVRNYLRRVKAQLAAHASEDIAAARARAEQMLLHAYAVAEAKQGHTMRGEAYADPDTKSMVAAAKALAEVHGAVGPTKHELSGPGGVPLVASVVILPPLEPEST